MCSLQRLLARMPELHADFFAACREAEQARPKEEHAAVVIQKYARGYLTRLRLDRLEDNIVRIQCCWRGYLGRQRGLAAKQARDKRLRQEYFDAMATTIQRHWRGFWSRKYLFDFRARQVYLARIADMNTKMRAVLAEEAERAAYTQKAIAQQSARAAFDERVSKLHHLLSTASQPGIFASPYAFASNTVPVIAGLPVEEHLKAAFKKTAPIVSPKKMRPPNGDGNNVTLPPITKQGELAVQDNPAMTNKGSGNSVWISKKTKDQAGALLLGNGQTIPRHFTLRQSVPYDTVHQAALLEQKVFKAEMMTRHPLPFTNTVHKPDAPTMAVQSNKNLETYNDPYDPIACRTQTFTPRQQNMSPKRFVRYPGKQQYFDTDLNPAVQALPPNNYKSLPTGQQIAAGLSSTEVQQQAQRAVQPGTRRPPANTWTLFPA